MFNKRHYEAIALALQEAIKFDATCSTEVAGIYKAADAMASLFARDNGRFNRERFLAACQPGANVKLRTRYKLVDKCTNRECPQYGGKPAFCSCGE